MVKDFQINTTIKSIIDEILDNAFSYSDFEIDDDRNSRTYVGSLIENIVTMQGEYVTAKFKRKEPVFLPFLGRFKIKPLKEVYLNIYDFELLKYKVAFNLDVNELLEEGDLNIVKGITLERFYNEIDKIRNPEYYNIKLSKEVYKKMKFRE